MERRDVLKGAGALTLAALSGLAGATEHEHHNHGHMHAAGNNTQQLLAAAGDCVQKAEACLSHCLILLGNGEKEMAACAQSVNQTMAICRALESLAGQNSKYAASLARVALDACLECEKECRKHEKKHAECKACADSCAACAKQCKALIG